MAFGGVKPMKENLYKIIRTVKKFGKGSAHVIVPKGLIDKDVIIYVIE
jgi:putative transposon-encoded protein